MKQKLLREKNPLTVAFNSTFRDIDDDFSVNYCYFHTNINSIYPSEIEIQDPKDSALSVNIRHLLLERDIDSNLTAKLYDKREDFNF